MRGIKYLLIGCLVLIASSSYASIIEYTTFKKGNNLENSTNISLKDDQYDYMQANSSIWPNEFSNVTAQNRVILEFTGQEKHYYNTAWDITASFQVNAYNESGVLIPSASNFETLTINFDPTANYKDISLYAFEGAHYVELTDVTIAKNGIAVCPEDVFLKIEIDVNRKYNYDRTNVPYVRSRVPGTVSDPIILANQDKQAELYWDFVDGATEYDLEWYWLDGAGTYLPTSFNGIRDIDFSRVTLSTNAYTLNLSYDVGKIYYRVRAVGRYGPNFECRKVGEWSDNFSQAYFLVDNLNRDKNWSYQAVFAEEGKKKEVVSYADGTIRTRQSVTINNSDNNAIIGETYYDYEGRAVISTLPTPDPLRSNKLMYYDDFNLNLNTASALSKVDYDFDNQSSSCEVPNLELDPSQGSSNYYSDQNANKEGFNAYIPSAENYPYARSSFDKYGRSHKSAGPGATHRMGNGHETTVYYLKPSQEKLDRLFGNEVGLAKHYELHATRDANGQLNLIYSNFGGQKVATSVVGAAPQSLTPLASNVGATTIVEDLHSFNDYVQSEESRVIDYPKFIEAAGNYSFVYNLFPETFDGLCDYNDQTNLDFACAYDLKITIYDACDNALYDSGNENILHEQIFNITSNTNYSLPLAFDVYFPNVGTYKIEKTLSLNNNVLDNHLALFDTYLRDESYEHDCIDNLSDLTSDYVGAIDWSNCYDCETYCDAFSDLCEENTCDIGTILAQEQNCSAFLQLLGSDMSPGGQYYDNHADPSNPNDWLNQSILGNLSQILAEMNAATGLSGSLTNWSTIRSHWADIQSQWSNSTYATPEEYMAQFHPEYCHYQWCVFSEPSTDFNLSLLALDFAGAVNAAYATNVPGIQYANLKTSEPLDQLDPLLSVAENVVFNQMAPNYMGTGTDLWSHLQATNAGATNDDLWQAFVGIYNGLKQEVLEDFKEKYFMGGCAYLSASPVTLANGFPNTTNSAGFYINFTDVNTFIDDNGLNSNATIGDWATDVSTTITPCVASITFNLGNLAPCDGDQSTKEVSPYLYIGANQITSQLQVSCPNASATDWANEIERAVLAYSYPGITIAVNGVEVTISIPDPNQELDGEDVYLMKGSTPATADFYFLFGEMETECSELPNCFCTELNMIYEFVENENPAFSAAKIHEFMAEDYNTSYSLNSVQPEDIAEWMSNCASKGIPEIDVEEESLIPAALLSNCNPEEEPCDQNPTSIGLATYHAQAEFESQVQEQRELFRAAYVAHCLNTNDDPSNTFNETFTIEGADYEYHFTLFFYDRAGNLTKTVPPEGVKLLDATALTAAAAHRATPTSSSTPFIRTSHTFKTTYEYNSLNQLVAENIPDAVSSNGATKRYWYDKIGRIAASQDALQASYAKPAYSYLLYDGQGRVIEGGEITASNDPTAAAINNNTFPDNWSNLTNTNNQKYRRQVTQSVYDVAPTVTPFTIAELSYLRSRISAIYYWNRTDDASHEFASYYSYDEHGYLKSVIKDNTFLSDLNQSLKRTDYEYDLISRNTNKVTYQGGEWDQFIHQYYYDADNRITNVLTSRDGHIWDQEEKYFYYEHGPMARTETGDKKVQGSDYAYTIQGWLKSVNANRLKGNMEMGKDGALTGTAYAANYPAIHQNIGGDAIAFSLSYFDNDYNSIAMASGGNDFWNDINNINTNGNYLSNQGNALYNGNIRSMTTHMLDMNESPIDLVANFYQYDQLQRIKGMDVYVSNTGKFEDAVNNGDYATSYTFDANGNLDNLTRNAYAGNINGTVHNNAMDDISYFYYGKDGDSYQIGQFGTVEPTNQLAYVSDGGDNQNGNLTFGDIQNNQSNANYTYNNRGDLISDAAEEIETIVWDQFGKIKSVTRFSESEKPDLYFHYDAIGHRSVKIVKPRPGGNPSNEDKWIYTFYSRDAVGNVLATYERSFEFNGTNYLDQLRLQELTFYGKKRIGVKKVTVAPALASFTSTGFTGNQFSNKNYAIDYDATTIVNDFYERNVGQKYYEFSNHLGNVLAVATDRAIGVQDASVSTTAIAFYKPDVVSYSDYYPYGMQMPNRNGSSVSYRYGFQGQEKDDEIAGEGNSYTAEFWQYDSRLGRRWNIDPVVKHHESPYATFANNPIWFSDPIGSDTIVRHRKQNDIKGVKRFLYTISPWHTVKLERSENPNYDGEKDRRKTIVGKHGYRTKFHIIFNKYKRYKIRIRYATKRIRTRTKTFRYGDWNTGGWQGANTPTVSRSYTNINIGNSFTKGGNNINGYLAGINDLASFSLSLKSIRTHMDHNNQLNSNTADYFFMLNNAPWDLEKRGPNGNIIRAGGRIHRRNRKVPLTLLDRVDAVGIHNQRLRRIDACHGLKIKVRVRTVKTRVILYNE